MKIFNTLRNYFKERRHKMKIKKFHTALAKVGLTPRVWGEMTPLDQIRCLRL